MACTTILVGKDASYDGSTIIARNEDSANGEFCPKRFIVVKPDEQPRHYKSVLSHVEVDLPGEPLQYTAVPNADLKEGIWGEAGVNEANVAMSATETLTTNERVLGADPFVEYTPAKGDEPEVPGGIGEEDFLTLVLPYVKTAREGVARLGALLEQYGTYEMNGVAFSDVDEIWWLETVGGHHWIAKRVPDEAYVTMPNQLGIDEFDLDDALGDQEEHMCSADLGEFIERNHLDLAVENVTPFNPRDAFGSHSDSDHVYNTPRAWYMQRFLNPYDEQWDGRDADHQPTSDDIPWARQPDRKITIEDVKYVLSSHYQGTPYDPYGKLGDQHSRHMFRPIGINRQSQLSVMQIRPYRPQVNRAVQWIAYGSNPFNTLVPFFPNVDSTPKYLEDTTTRHLRELLLGEPHHRGPVRRQLRRHRQCGGTLPGEDRRHGPPHGSRHRRADRPTGGRRGRRIRRRGRDRRRAADGTGRNHRSRPQRRGARSARRRQRDHGRAAQGGNRQAARLRALHHQHEHEERLPHVRLLIFSAIAQSQEIPRKPA